VGHTSDESGWSTWLSFDEEVAVGNVLLTSPLRHETRLSLCPASPWTPAIVGNEVVDSFQCQCHRVDVSIGNHTEARETEENSENLEALRPERASGCPNEVQSKIVTSVPVIGETAPQAANYFIRAHCDIWPIFVSLEQAEQP
jgi:hypothetical protein